MKEPIQKIPIIKLVRSVRITQPLYDMGHTCDCIYCKEDKTIYKGISLVDAKEIVEKLMEHGYIN
jgi:ribosomal protein L7/L12